MHLANDLGFNNSTEWFDGQSTRNAVGTNPDSNSAGDPDKNTDKLIEEKNQQLVEHEVIR